MNNQNNIQINKINWPLILDSVALFAIVIVGYFVYSQSQTILVLKNEMSSSTQILKQRITILEAGLATSTLTSNQLSQQLVDQQNQSNAFQNTISDIAGTVGTLKKLSETDKELLQKYSKIYFLSDNYVPMSLTTIDGKYLFDKIKSFQFHTNALPFLTRMLDQASNSGVSIKIVSAYRSFGTQSTLKNDYLVTYGSGANQFSADQGYSEHQLGTAVDLADEKSKSPLEISFDSTSAFTWLSQNAYKFGFILSYPKDNAYYVYEPWHWRFVGIELATRLAINKTNFSDLDQRTINTYLVNIFDEQ